MIRRLYDLDGIKVELDRTNTRLYFYKENAYLGTRSVKDIIEDVLNKIPHVTAPGLELSPSGVLIDKASKQLVNGLPNLRGYLAARTDIPKLSAQEVDRVANIIRSQIKVHPKAIYNISLQNPPCEMDRGEDVVITAPVLSR